VPKIFVKDILPNQDVESLFVVADKQLRVARNGARFLTLKLVDRTGEITGRIWDKAEEAEQSINAKGAVSLTGKSEQFRDELQLNISRISPVPADSIDPSDFLPRCPVTGEILLEKLKKVAAAVKRRPLKLLCGHLFADRELMERFRLAPAAKSMHHAYLGGLLEHTASVASLALLLSEQYPELDGDLLVAGAILHDIGKIEEFVYDLCIDYSDAGRLLGHIVLGTEILEKTIRKLRNFPAEEAILLKHLILSHHGEAEFGAVRLPMTREAIVLHFADDLDAKMNSVGRIIGSPKDGDQAWTTYQPLFERFFFRGFPAQPQDESLPISRPAPDAGRQLSLWPRDGKEREA
jgi:3'-5' exoribonuclease